MLFFLSLLATVFALERALRARDAEGRARLWLAAPLLPATLAVLTAPRGQLLTKAIGALSMPLGLLWLLLLGLAIGAAWRGRRGLAAVFAGLCALLTVAGSEPLSEWALGVVEGEHATMRPLRARPFDAVVVLGGGTDDTPRGDVQLGASGDRVMLGARLYQRRLTPLLVTSGSPIVGLSDHDAAAATSTLWRELGIPAEAIVVVDGARTTSEEARLHAELIRARGWRRVGLVTSAFHLRRARALFEAAGVEVVPLPADVRSRPPEWHGFVSLVPKAPAAYDLHVACWEIVGRLGGR